MKKNSEFPLKQWLYVNEVKGLLFDLDDTIIQTNEIFAVAVQKVIGLYSRVIAHLSADEVARIFSDINISVHKRCSVNPNRWQQVILEFEQETSIEHSIAAEVLLILSGIYKQNPQFEKDAYKLLLHLKKWQMVLGLVTHANVEWTVFKLKSLGLESFFDHVQIVCEDQPHKDSTDWQAAADTIHIAPKYLLAGGDNVQGDVQAAMQAGFGQVVWVDKKNGWHHYRTGKLPSGILVVETISDLLSLNFKKQD